MKLQLIPFLNAANIFSPLLILIRLHIGHFMMIVLKKIYSDSGIRRRILKISCEATKIKTVKCPSIHYL